MSPELKKEIQVRICAIIEDAYREDDALREQMGLAFEKNLELFIFFLSRRGCFNIGEYYSELRNLRDNLSNVLQEILQSGVIDEPEEIETD